MIDGINYQPQLVRWISSINSILLLVAIASPLKSHRKSPESAWEFEVLRYHVSDGGKHGNLRHDWRHWLSFQMFCWKSCLSHGINLFKAARIAHKKKAPCFLGYSRSLLSLLVVVFVVVAAAVLLCCLLFFRCFLLCLLLLFLLLFLFLFLFLFWFWFFFFLVLFLFLLLLLLLLLPLPLIPTNS